MLDNEKVRCLIKRKSEINFNDHRLIEYCSEIQSLLSKDLYDTKKFLEICTDEELEWLAEDIYEICFAFQDKESRGEFIEFLLNLSGSRAEAEIFAEELKLTIEALKDDDDLNYNNK